MKLKKLKEDTLVKIKNSNEYLILMNLAEKSGYKWLDGSNPTKYDEDKNRLKATGIHLYQDRTILYCAGTVLDIDSVPFKKVIKFEVGDKVMVRKDLVDCNSSQFPYILPKMLNFAGKEFYIDSIVKSKVSKYRLKEIPSFAWRKKWLEPVLPEFCCPYYKKG